MPVKFDPLLGKLRVKDQIPEYSSDPTSPQPQDAWVLKTVSGASGGGKMRAAFGLGFPYLTVGVGGSTTYQFSYRTTEGTTKRVTLA